jgi:rhodanese-related sulfurtransferase
LLSEGHVYLDVRSPDEFALGHPQGAYNVPWLDPAQPHSPNARFLEVVCRAFDKAQPIVVGCQSGQRSVAAAEALLAAGFARVVEQRAGFGGQRDAFGGLLEPGWQRCGLPVAYQPEPKRAHDYDAMCGDDGSDSVPASER